jgi:hypothetical protein
VAAQRVLSYDELVADMIRAKSAKKTDVDAMIAQLARIAAETPVVDPKVAERRGRRWHRQWERDNPLPQEMMRRFKNRMTSRYVLNLRASRRQTLERIPRRTSVERRPRSRRVSTRARARSPSRRTGEPPEQPDDVVLLRGAC